jgi:hypothetical protein
MDNLYVRRTYEPLKFLGRLFWVPMKVAPQTPLVSYAPTWEADGSRWGPTLVVRLPFRYAVGLGVWLDMDAGDVIPVHVEDAEYEMYQAINGYIPREKWQAARRKISEMGLDPDDEMELMQMIGVFE